MVANSDEPGLLPPFRLKSVDGVRSLVGGCKSIAGAVMCGWLRLCKGFFRLMLIVAESGHVSGLLARYALPLALMKSAYRVPNQTNEL